MAKRIKFAADFDYRIPGTRSDVAYKAGTELLVPEDHAQAAIAAGKAQLSDPQKKAARK